MLVPLEEWKRLNKNGGRVGGGGGGDTYTTIEIPSCKPRNQEGRGKNQEEREELNPPPPISHRPALWDDKELRGPPLPPPPSPPLLPLLPSSLSSPPQKRKEGKGEGREGEGRGELKLSEMLVVDLLEKEFR